MSTSSPNAQSAGIPLRIAHLIDTLHVSAASSAVINSMRWFKQHGHSTVLATEGGERYQGCLDEGLELLRYKRGGLGWMLQGKRKLEEDLQAWRPDILHIHRARLLEQGIRIAKRLQVALAVSVHAIFDDDDAKALRNKHVAMVFVPSEAHRAHYVGRVGIDRDKVAVVPYAFDLRRFPVQDVSTEGPLCLGAIGRFQEHGSGLPTLLNAVQILRDQKQDFRVHIVEDEALIPETQSAVKQAALDDYVMVQASTVKTAPHLRKMDAFVYVPDEDTHSLTIIKAFACGLPVVATAVGGVMELVSDQENGLLVPSRDATAVAHALKRLIADRQFAQHLGQHGREQAVRHHDIEVIGTVLHELYRNLLSNRHRAVGTEAVQAFRRVTSSIQEEEA